MSWYAKVTSFHIYKSNYRNTEMDINPKAIFWLTPICKTWVSGTYSVNLRVNDYLVQPCHGWTSCSNGCAIRRSPLIHDDVIKWKHFPRYWPFVRGIHRVNSPHKGQWRGALMFPLICVWKNSWRNNHEAGDFRRYRAHHDVFVMSWWRPCRIGRE